MHTEALQQVQDSARKFKGVRWVHQGRTPHGLDCIGLLVIVARDLGYAVVDRTDYPPRPLGNEFHEVVQAQTVAMREPAPGLLGFFRQGPLAAHCGIFSLYRGQELRLIHAYRPRGRVTEDNYLGTCWQDYLIDVRAYRETV